MTTGEPVPAAMPQPNLVSIDHPLGSRINVRGGGGKTTLARALAAKLHLPFIELDALFWLPNWQERDAEDFRQKTQEAIESAPAGWVVDGNYTESLEDLVLRQADTIVWLNLPWRVVFWRILIRSILRARDKQIVCGSNTESWRALLSRDSLWWWYIANRGRLIQRGERLLPMVPLGVPVVEIRSRKGLDAFYEVHGLARS